MSKQNYMLTTAEPDQYGPTVPFTVDPDYPNLLGIIVDSTDLPVDRDLLILLVMLAGEASGDNPTVLVECLFDPDSLHDLPLLSKMHVPLFLESERRYVLRALSNHNGIVTIAVRLLMWDGYGKLVTTYYEDGRHEVELQP